MEEDVIFFSLLEGDVMMDFLKLDSIEDRVKLINLMKDTFRTRGGKMDAEGLFPFENIDDLKRSGYTMLTVPQELGGKGISLYEMVRLQEKIAEGDGATALSIGWHMGIIKNLAEKRLWTSEMYSWICGKVRQGALINGAATEPQTGSPTRGGKPFTTAKEKNGKWLINGRKIFTTMAPILDFFIVSATMEDGEVGNFLIQRDVSGVNIEETWDSIAMRGTGSHDLVLDHVEIEKEYLVERLQSGKRQANGWLLHIPACYLGIAYAARSYSVKFAKEYSPSSISGTISDLPNVQQKIGEMELILMQSKYFLYSVAKQWDQASEQDRQNMLPLLGAVKHAVTNSAISVVDLAMRIVGAKSLSQQNPLQRYYRDVRAGLHNPPMDDMTIRLLAEETIRSV
ncbi:short-chain-specific acyl-CoA dehydrogenase [Bacillus sp. 1NLA3E]|nr:short-chain-specific acyl-CoA dehydrogenase [Bacillus sp. 1NLA3E]